MIVRLDKPIRRRLLVNASASYGAVTGLLSAHRARITSSNLDAADLPLVSNYGTNEWYGSNVSHCLFGADRQAVPSLKRIKELSSSSVDEDVREWDKFVEQQQHQHLQRTGILAELRQEPANDRLQAYLQRLKRGPENTDDNGGPIWDPNTFIEGVRRFAELLGSQRSQYYDNPLKRLHYPHTFLNQWAQSYSELPDPRWLDDFRWQCPPGWLSKIVKPHNAWVLSYNGTEPLSKALNNLILGPTTVHVLHSRSVVRDTLRVRR